MTLPRRLPRSLLSWLLFGSGVALLAAACGEDGATPTCPDLKLYKIGAAGERQDPEVGMQRDRAVDAGCMTPLTDAATD